MPGQIYRWRQELGTTAVGFAKVMVSPSPGERLRTDTAAIEIEFGSDIRVRIPATAPKEPASAVIKALAAR